MSLSYNFKSYSLPYLCLKKAEMKKLQNKIALISGAAQGIGAGIAESFIEQGAQVVISDINDDKGRVLAEELGDQAFYQHLDVSREDDWISVLSWIKETFKELHILVNNAGVTGFHKDLGSQNPETASLDSWNEVHNVNLDGVFLGCKHAIQLMKLQPTMDSIINISSRSGMVGIPHAAAYASSKAAVRNHTKSVALFCAEMQYNIRCNSIHPAVILTEMWEPMLGSGEDRNKKIKDLSTGIPLCVLGMPKDVANATLYLACDESRYVTGIELTIDGGILAGASASPGS